MANYQSQVRSGGVTGRAGSGASAPGLAPGKRTLTEDLYAGPDGGGGGSGAAADVETEAIPKDLLDAIRQDAKPDPKNNNATGKNNRLQGAATKFGGDVMALWSYCKDHIPLTATAKAYATGPGDPQTKLALLGQMAAARARLEFLVGWILQGGIQVFKEPEPPGYDKDKPPPTAGNWENNPKPAITNDNSTNHGTIVDQYTSAAAGYGRSDDWCGMFVGFVMAEIGMNPVVKDPGDLTDPAADHLALASSARMMEFLQATIPGSGGKPAKRVAGPGEAVLWLAPGAVPQIPVMTAPQAGDVVVFDHHVSMIERYESGRIDTIDGNVGLQLTRAYATDCVSGASYQLPQNDDKGKPKDPQAMVIRAIWRPGIDAYRNPPDAAAGAAGNATAAAPVDGNALLAQIQRACEQVTALYSEISLAGASAVNDRDSVATIARNVATKKS